MQREPSVCNNAVLREATRRLGQLYDEYLRPSGLRATQYTILARVNRAPGGTMQALAQRLVMDQSALGHTLKPLIRDGYLELVVDERDRRAKIVRLTAAGAAKLAEAALLWHDAQAAFEAAYGVANAAELREALAHLASKEFRDAVKHAVPKPQGPL